MDVEVLLRGAERLCAVYPVAGAAENIAMLRARYKEVSGGIEVYESRVGSQQAARLREEQDGGVGEGREDEDVGEQQQQIDIEELEREVQELEVRKRTLEGRVRGIEKDLGGLRII